MFVRGLLRATAFGAIAILGACSGGDTASDPGGGGGGGGTQVPAEILAMEDQTFDLINAERALAAIAPLVHDDTLRTVARAHSEDMVVRDFFSHTNPDGDDPFDRMLAAGITFQLAGENIAWNQGYADPATTAVDGWMNSAGHRANILRSEFTHSGLGVARKDPNAWYFTQVFIRPATGSLVMRSWVVEAGPDEGSWTAEAR
jgi:hypothetical protein